MHSGDKIPTISKLLMQSKYLPDGHQQTDPKNGILISGVLCT